MAVVLATAPGAATAATRAPLASPAPGVFGIGPSGATKLDGRPYYYYLGGPGSQLSDHVAVVNVGTATLTLGVYPTDASNSPDGSFAFPAAAVKAVDVGSWVHIRLPHGRRTITIKGRTTVFLPVQVEIPVNAVPGDHAGALVASLQGVARNSNGQLIHLDQRVATRIFIRVAGPLHPRLAIEHLTATYHASLNPVAKGDVTVTYTVHNTGNVKLAGSQVVEVSGIIGATTATGAAQVPLLLPGASVLESVRIRGVWPQVWMSGTVTVSALGLRSDVDPRAGPWTATTHFWAIPWALILVLFVIVGGTLGWLRIRRARVRRGPPRSGRTAPGDVHDPGAGGPGAAAELVGGRDRAAER